MFYIYEYFVLKAIACTLVGVRMEFMVFETNPTNLNARLLLENIYVYLTGNVQHRRFGRFVRYFISVKEKKAIECWLMHVYRA